MARPLSIRGAYFFFLLSPYSTTWDRRRLEGLLVVQRPYYLINMPSNASELTITEGPLTEELEALGKAVARIILQQERSKK